MKRNKLFKVVLYTVYCFFVLAVADLILFKRILNYGYPYHYHEANTHRSPKPYIMFAGKPNVPQHNELGFKGKSLRDADPNDFKIAFWGGSTGYNGNPPIAELLEIELEKELEIDVFVANFSILSSNHRQHLHGILEYLPSLNPDLVLFYGGYNETIQSGVYDPRPGYPYNYFFRAELSNFKKELLKRSAIAGEFDKRTGYITGLKELRNGWKPFSDDWNESIVAKYFETLDLSNKVSQTLDSNKFGKSRFMAFYQPYQVPDEFLHTHSTIREKIDSLDYIFDVSEAYDSLGIHAYTDIVHVNQAAKHHMAKIIAEKIVAKLQQVPAIE